MLAALLEKLPEEMRQSEEVKFLSSAADRHVANIVQLIYRAKGYEGDSKDYEFSRRSMEEHWRAGYCDAVHALRHPEIFEPAGTKRSSPSTSAVIGAIEADANDRRPATLARTSGGDLRIGRSVRVRRREE
jgi:hypothetical protein